MIYGLLQIVTFEMHNGVCGPFSGFNAQNKGTVYHKITLNVEIFIVIILFIIMVNYIILI